MSNLLSETSAAILPSKSIVVATHGHCFDGLCSAVLFTQLMRHIYPGTSLSWTYHSSGYGPGQNGVDPKLLVGDENAILDFRFSTAPALSWYFDHHVSAFPGAEDRAGYEAHVERAQHLAPDLRRMFHDGAYSSCTKLIADIGASVFGLDAEPMRYLVEWADMIDSAAFPNAEMAVLRREPELQLMTVVESKCNDAFLQTMVPRLLEQPLAEVARSPEVLTAYEPLRAAQEFFIRLVRSHAKIMDDVVLVNLTDYSLDVAGKFITYALYPQSRYSVVVTRSRSKCKLSIGYNPWSPRPRGHNIAAICERHGGGGHPVVGAISLTADQVTRAQSLALEIARELLRDAP